MSSVGPTVAFSVMGHELRRERAWALGEHLQSPVFLDVGAPSRERELLNGDVAWRLGAAGDWTVVVQDDALPVHDFRKHVRAALAVAPKTAVSFYFGQGRPLAGLTRYIANRANQIDADWIEWDQLAWGVAVAMPTESVEEFLAWGQGSTLRYDRRIGEFWREKRKPIVYTWPSLVDHDDELPTLAHRTAAPMSRTAYRTGEGRDWTGRVLRVGANQRVRLSE